VPTLENQPPRTQDAHPPERDPGPGPDPRRWRALGVLAVVQFMIVIDSTAVNIALPSIRTDLGMSEAGLAWVVNGYLLTAGGLVLLGGRIADLFGRKKVFLVGTALFAVASLTSGTAVDPGMLIASRFGQGMGEALASPAALSLIVVMFDGKERVKALGVWGGLSGMGATVGVLLSGVLVDLSNWRLVFFINLPIAAVALVLAIRMVVDVPVAAGKRRLDVFGGLLVTGALVALVNGLLNAGEHPWGSVRVWASFAGGVVLLVAFVAVEATVAEPMMPLRFFRNRTRITANVATVLLNSSMAGMFFLVTLYLRQVLGYSPLRSGLAYVPFCVGFVPGMTLSMQLISRFGAKVAAVSGFLVTAAGMLLLARIDVAGSFWGQLVPATLVLSIGLSIGLPALQNAALFQLPDQDAGIGSGVQNSVQQLGSSLGLAVLTMLALNRTRQATASGMSPGAATVAGYHLVFEVAAAVLAGGAILAAVAMQRHVGTADHTGAGAQPAKSRSDMT
jgi:EmrB/QacA subfamily drug resistance transporter